jgi:hypothetical protein
MPKSGGDTSGDTLLFWFQRDTHAEEARANAGSLGREPGSDIWWIRYRPDGFLKREKVGAKGAAKELLNKRKNEIREGIKMPENMRQTPFAISLLGIYLT